MENKILAINISKNEADRLAKEVGISVDRGYLESFDEQSSIDKIGKYVHYYFPYSIHEYKALIINFNKIKGLEEEFAEEAKPYSRKRIDDFINYWLVQKLPVIVYLGNYDSKSILLLGIRGISLDDVDTIDKTVNTFTAEFDEIFDKHEKNVNMPAKKYISVGFAEDDFYEMYNDIGIKYIYKNNAQKIIGCYHNGHRFDFRPSLLLLPQFKDSVSISKDILFSLSRTYPKLLPELQQPDWTDADKYLPKIVRDYDDKINSFIEKAQKVIDKLKKQKQKTKEKYSSLSIILSSSGNELKSAVMDVLESIFELQVEDADERKKNQFDEDLIVTLDRRKILCEVKGDSASYPSVKHIIQVLKHLNKSKDTSHGALFLNYDIKTEPEKRALAYTGSDEEHYDSISFIDTREVHRLAEENNCKIFTREGKREGEDDLYKIPDVCIELGIRYERKPLTLLVLLDFNH